MTAEQVEFLKREWADAQENYGKARELKNAAAMAVNDTALYLLHLVLVKFEGVPITELRRMAQEERRSKIAKG